ncbi:MAG: aquaporin [Candidatus Poseidoniaceae archaeon]|nr:aquaporin [Candidatus Poseidoniaceae archaeon]
MLKRLGAEFLGTALMVFLGCLSIKLEMSNLLISSTFGIAVFIAILVLRNTSGAHINPAVSIAFYRSNHLEKNALLPYIFAQLLGALAGALIVGQHGFTNFKVDLGVGIIIEVMITFLLMMGIYFIISKTDDTRIVALWVGFVVAILAFFFGPYTGASMNPARTFGPNLISGEISVIPIYWITTIIGAVLASQCYKILEKSKLNSNIDRV